MLVRYQAAWRLLPASGRLYLGSEAVAALAAGAMGAVFNLYVRALGFDPAFLGNLLTVTAIGAGLGAATAGRIVDRAGPRFVLLASSLVTAAGIAGQLLTSAAPVLLAAGFVTGLGAAAYYVAAAPFLARVAGASALPATGSPLNAAAPALAAVGAAMLGLAGVALRKRS